MSRALERGHSWGRALEELPAADRARFSSANLGALSRLVESDSNPYFYTELLSLGRSLESSDPEIAARIYSVLSAVPEWSQSPGEAQQVNRRLDVLRGGGTFGDRFERFASSFISQALDPATLVGIGVAGLAYRGVRLAAMSRLAAQGVGSFPRSGLFLASLAGFAAEVPAFSLSAALTNTLRGESVDWSPGAIAVSLGHGALNLGSMRVAGAVIGGLGRRYFATADLGTLGFRSRLGLGVVQQASMLGGIMLSQQVEGLFNPSHPTSFSDRLGQGLANLLIFNASGAVARRVYGSRFAAFERDLENRSHSLTLGFNVETGRPNPIPAADDPSVVALRRIPHEDFAPVINLHVPAPDVPGPRRVIPHVAALLSTLNSIPMARRMINERAKIMGAARGSGGNVLVKDAVLAKEVLSNPRLWPRVGTPLKVPEDTHPHIVLMSSATPFVNGRTWEARRRTLRPAMSGANTMNLMAPIFENSLNEFSRDWLKQGRMDLTEDTMRITMRNNMRGLMGVEPAAGEAIAGDIRQFLRGFLSLPVLVSQKLGGNRVIPGTPFARWLADGDRLYRSLVELVESKRANPSQDPIGVLINTVDKETGHSLTNAEVIGELVTFYAAGHETTARTLGWAMLMLAHHPEAARRASQEVGDVLQGRTPTFEDQKNLKFLDSVLNESQRLIPVLSLGLPRGTTEDRILGCIRLPAGSTVAISTYAQHHDPEVFSRPGTFMPERWETQEIPPYQFTPLGFGPRRCLGGVFAEWQMKATLAMMLQRYSFRPTTNRVNYEIFNTMTRPKGNLHLQVLAPGNWAESAPLTGSIRDFVYP